MNTTYKLETGIAVPAKHSQTQGFTQTLRKMEVGQSFFAREKTIFSAGGSIRNIRREEGTIGWRFTCRAIEEDGIKGIRVWRTE